MLFIYLYLNCFYFQIKKEKDKKIKQEIKQEESPKKGGRKKKEEEPVEVWKW